MESTALGEVMLQLLVPQLKCGAAFLIALIVHGGGFLRRLAVPPRAFYFTWFCVALLVGLGHVFEFIIGEVLQEDPSTRGLVFQIEFRLAQTLGSLLGALSNGALPAVLMSVALASQRIRDSMFLAGLVGPAVLISIDLSLYLSAFAVFPFGRDSLIDDLSISILFDLVGGPVASLMGQRLLKMALMVPSSRQGRRQLAHWVGFAVLAMLGVSAVAGAGYLVFAKPLTSVVALTIDGFDSLTVSYKEKYEILPGAKIDKEYQSALSELTWSLSATETEATAFGKDDWRFVATGDGRGSPIRANIFAAIGCEDSDAVTKLIGENPNPGVVLNLDASTLHMYGTSQSINVTRPESVKLLFAIPFSTAIEVDSNEHGNRIFAALGKSTITVPAMTGSAIVFAAVPELNLDVDYSDPPPSKRGDVRSVALMLRTPTGAQPLVIARPTGVEGECRRISFMGNQMAEGNLASPMTLARQFIVVSIVDADPKASIAITSELMHIKISGTEGRLSTSSFEPVDLVRAMVSKGVLSIGAQKFELGPNDYVSLAKDNLYIKEDKNGSIFVGGNVRYVLVNGVRLTPSFWHGMDVGYQIGILSILGAGILALLKQSYIRQLMRRWFS